MKSWLPGQNSRAPSGPTHRDPLKQADDVHDRLKLITSVFRLLLTTSIHAGLLSLPANVNKVEEIKLPSNGERDHQYCCTVERSRRKTNASLHWKTTSFSQSHRMVMMASISVWTAVPPKIIPAQIPWSIMCFQFTDNGRINIIDGFFG